MVEVTLHVYGKNSVKELAAALSEWAGNMVCQEVPSAPTVRQEHSRRRVSVWVHSVSISAHTIFPPWSSFGCQPHFVLIASTMRSPRPLSSLPSASVRVGG